MSHYACQLAFSQPVNCIFCPIRILNWQPVKCINIGGHVALLSGPTVCLLYSGADAQSYKREASAPQANPSLASKEIVIEFLRFTALFFDRDSLKLMCYYSCLIRLQYIFIKLQLSNENIMDLSYNDVKCGVEMLRKIGLAQ